MVDSSLIFLTQLVGLASNLRCIPFSWNPNKLSLKLLSVAKSIPMSFFYLSLIVREIYLIATFIKEKHLESLQDQFFHVLLIWGYAGGIINGITLLVCKNEFVVYVNHLIKFSEGFQQKRIQKYGKDRSKLFLIIITLFICTQTTTQSIAYFLHYSKPWHYFSKIQRYFGATIPIIWVCFLILHVIDLVVITGTWIGLPIMIFHYYGMNFWLELK